jgi:hypothetical protein
VRWRALAVSSDSVAGIPDTLPSTCGTCRITLPRSVVDSIALVYGGGRRAPTLPVFLLAVAAATVILLVPDH